MTSIQQDKEIQQLDPLTRCDYFQAIDLGESHNQAIVLAKDSKLFEAFLNSKIK